MDECIQKESCLQILSVTQAWTEFISQSVHISFMEYLSYNNTYFLVIRGVIRQMFYFVPLQRLKDTLHMGLCNEQWPSALLSFYCQINIYIP